MFNRNNVPLRSVITFRSDWDQKGREYRVIRRGKVSVTVEWYNGDHYCGYIATVPYSDIIAVSA